MEGLGVGEGRPLERFGNVEWGIPCRSLSPAYSSDKSGEEIKGCGAWVARSPEAR